MLSLIPILLLRGFLKLSQLFSLPWLPPNYSNLLKLSLMFPRLLPTSRTSWTPPLHKNSPLLNRRADLFRYPSLNSNILECINLDWITVCRLQEVLNFSQVLPGFYWLESIRQGNSTGSYNSYCHTTKLQNGICFTVQWNIYIFLCIGRDSLLKGS